MDFLTEYDPWCLEGTADPLIDDVKKELACPYCQSISPTLSLVNGEYIPDCCNALLDAVERIDPDDEKHLLDITNTPLAALNQWRDCVRLVNAS